MHDFSTRKPLFHKFSFCEFDYNLILKSLEQINVICNRVLSSTLLSCGLFTCMWRVLSHRDKLAQHVYYFQTIILRSIPIAVRKPDFELGFCILKKIIYSKIKNVALYLYILFYEEPLTNWYFWELLLFSGHDTLLSRTQEITAATACRVRWHLVNHNM